MEGKSFIYIHAIFTVKEGKPLLKPTVCKVLFAHLPVAAGAKGVELLCVNGAADHLHVLFKMMPLQSASGVVKQLKELAAFWLNENKLLPAEVQWGEAAWFYSVSPTMVDKTIEYISRQEQYHIGKTLADELHLFDTLHAARQEQG